MERRNIRQIKTSYIPRRRKKTFKRYQVMFLTFLITLISVFAIVQLIHFLKSPIYDNGFIPAPYGTNVSEKVKKAEETEIPEWIDVQLIHKHSTARTGFRLADIDNIVIHYVGNPGSTAQNNRDYFDKSSTEVSSHFVVGLDGEIIQCVPIYEKSAASNERNRDSISIEVCHKDETGKFNEKTYSSLVKLVSWLCNEFSLDESQIIRHYDITGKECPKYYVENEDEWEKFKSDVEEMLDE